MNLKSIWISFYISENLKIPNPYKLLLQINFNNAIWRYKTASHLQGTYVDLLRDTNREQ